MAEFEELRLRVTLDDQASGQLARLRTELGQLGGGPQAQGFERLGGQTRQLTALMRPLATGSLSARTAMSGLASVIGPLGIAVAGLGYAFYNQTQKLKNFAEGMLTIDAKARALGMEGAQYENLERQFRRMGLSSQEGHQVISGVVRGIADINRDGSAIFKRLMESTTDQGAMRAWINRLTGITDTGDWASVINEVVDGVNIAYQGEMDRLMREGVSRTRAQAMAADLVRDLLDALNIPDEAYHKITGRLASITSEQEQDYERRFGLSKAYMEQYNELAGNFTSFWRGMQTGLLDVMTEINKYLSENSKSAEEWGKQFGESLAGLLGKILKTIEGIERLSKWLEQLKTNPRAAISDAFGAARQRMAEGRAYNRAHREAVLNLADAEGAAAAGQAALEAFRESQGRQFGGPVVGGNPYMVGEGGPETFVPGTRESREQLTELRDNTEALEEQTTKSSELSDQLRELNDFLMYRKLAGGAGADGAVAARQGGGAVAGGQPYLVGEGGPELFVPQASGTVQPNQGGNASLLAQLFGGGGSDAMQINVGGGGDFMAQMGGGGLGGLMGAFFGAGGQGGMGPEGLRGRQGGGAVAAGQPYIVGEAGPELFVPQAGGQIDPMSGRVGQERGGGLSAEQALHWGIYGAGLAADVTGLAPGAGGVGHAVSRASGMAEAGDFWGVFRGLLPGMGVLEAMRRDEHDPSNPLRTKLRAMLGIEDPGEPTRWQAKAMERTGIDTSGEARGTVDRAAGGENIVEGTSTVEINVAESNTSFRRRRSLLKRTQIARKSQMEEAEGGPASRTPAASQVQDEQASA